MHIKLKQNESITEFTQTGNAFAAAAEYAGATEVFKLYKSKSDEKEVLLKEKYKGSTGLFITIRLGECPEHL